MQHGINGGDRGGARDELRAQRTAASVDGRSPRSALRKPTLDDQLHAAAAEARPSRDESPAGPKPRQDPNICIDESKTSRRSRCDESTTSTSGSRRGTKA